MSLVNENPIVYEVNKNNSNDINWDDNTMEPYDNNDIFELIRKINDPEHPLTLEQLNVAQLDLIHVDNDNNQIDIKFTPTIPHCSMATLIGLCIRVQLLRSLPSRFKIRIGVTEGTHQSEHAVNKQINDKERVTAALENTHLLNVVNQCLKTTLE
ncbi:hypothetical protein BC833DRAFT_581592 [Globomyces pollinis-pini]|nr:hypothetical protein BC833DRAFT_581592 [Globomyces pollinis-pini]KAJ2999615.1 Mitotic spindle-associated MMXD complex subunit MIP18 [Globomyces sp. JEL0801]